MEESKAVTLTKSLLHDYYEYGSTLGLAELMEEGTVAFGVHSEDFAVGKEKAIALLEEEWKGIEPCRIVKINGTERQTKNGPTVHAHVIFHTNNRMFNMHSVIFMFDITESKRLLIRGIHISRDARHEKTYQRVSSDLLNRGESNTESQQSVMGLVANYVNFSYVTYYLEDNEPFSYYGEDLWKMLGYASRTAFESRMVRPCRQQLIYEPDRELVNEEMRGQLMGKDNCQVEYRIRRRDGSLIWVMECGRAVRNPKTGVKTISSIITNISPLKQTHERFLFALRHDKLTGLYNKQAFCRRTEEILMRHQDEEFEILAFDIDRFKVINDLFGEATGDRLLRYIADFLRHVELPLMTYGRLHSDHFIVCYPVQKNARDHLITSLKTLAASFALDYRVEFSFGVYRVSDRTLSMNAMCDRALIALSQAKENGLIECGVYIEDMRSSMVNEQVITNHMRDSLAHQDFVIYLQPKYDIEKNRIVGAESLVRWSHPKLGFVSPGKFIPVFEHNGFIYQLDKYVWEKSCEFLRRSLDLDKPALPISVNVSRIDLYSPDIVKDFVDLVRKYNLPPRLLELELTESAYVDNPQHIIDITKQLQQYGFPILMDDFGSGYSSLNMLKDLPVDVLKIDLKFLDYVDGSPEATRGNSILRSIVRMAQWLDLKVIAEGVETSRQVDFLRSIGCRYVQGYYYSKPVPVETYERMCREEQKAPKRQQGASEPGIRG
jgi:diguanylate cyclase (GGDEF)-like protein/PAS domain S-box-containing protein